MDVLEVSVNFVSEPGWTNLLDVLKMKCSDAICLVILMLDNLEMHFHIPCKQNIAPDPHAPFAVHKLHF